MTSTRQAIETMFLEERRYEPPPEFAAQANAQPDVYDRDPDEFWETEARERVTWVQAVRHASRVGAAVREVVRRRHAERRLQLRRPARRGRTRRQDRLLLGGGARGRPARDHVRRPAGRGRPLCQRAAVARCRQGHARRDLHGHGSGAPDRDARVCALGRAAHGRLRRLLRGVALRPSGGHGMRGARHAGRRLAARAARAAQAERRRGARVLAVRRALRRPAADGGRRGYAGRARPLVARPRRRAAVRAAELSPGADGRRGPALPALHERHHGQAEGDRAYDGRLPRRRRVDAPLALVDHQKVAESAVCGRSDPQTGQAIVAYVTLKGGEEGSVEMLEELREHVARKIGAIAKPANIVFTPELPKTRSGKIMRRLLRDVAENRPLGDTTTLADPTVVEEIKTRAVAETSDE